MLRTLEAVVPKSVTETRPWPAGLTVSNPGPLIVSVKMPVLVCTGRMGVGPLKKPERRVRPSSGSTLGL
jgi:hypothetical protein